MSVLLLWCCACINCRVNEVRERRSKKLRNHLGRPLTSGIYGIHPLLCAEPGVGLLCEGLSGELGSPFPSSGAACSTDKAGFHQPTPPGANRKVAHSVTASSDGASAVSRQASRSQLTR